VFKRQESKMELKGRGWTRSGEAHPKAMEAMKKTLGEHVADVNGEPED